MKLRKKVFDSNVVPSTFGAPRVVNPALAKAAAPGYGAGARSTPQLTGSIGDSKQVSFQDANTSTQRAGTIGTNLATGTSWGKGNSAVSATEYLNRQAAVGTPLGMTYKQAANSAREDAIMGAGAQQLADYSQGASLLAGGKMGDAAYAPVQGAVNNMATAGQPNFQNAGGAAQSMMQTGQAMGGDIANLRQAAAGAVPSAAQIQQRQGIGDAIAAQQAVAASARGGNVAGAMRSAMGAGQSIQNRGIADAAALRANEMAQARAQLTNASAAQGSVFGSAGGLSRGIGDSEAARANATMQGQNVVAQGRLGAQVTGMNALQNAFAAEQARTGSAVATDRQDQEDLNNYLLQLANQGLGHGASVYGANKQADVAYRGQNIQLLGAAANAVGTGLAGFSQYGR